MKRLLCCALLGLAAQAGAIDLKGLNPDMSLADAEAAVPGLLQSCSESSVVKGSFSCGHPARYKE